MQMTFLALKNPCATRAWPTLLVVASLLFCVNAQAGITLTRPEAVLGPWDLTLDQSDKKCRVTLRAEPVHGGLHVAMPAGCRRSLPILATVGAWSLLGDDHLNLADVYGRSVLDFSFETATTLTASGQKGEIYRLAPVLAPDGEASAPKDAPSSNQRAAEPALEPIKFAAKTNSVSSPVRPSDVSGRYSVFRESGKDTGCMVTLDSSAKAGGGKASLAPACRDQGIVIFDPTGWQLVNGRLVLTARKGHTTHLDRQPDGAWLKDPKEGKSLSLKKL
jgi:hypothetical protein